MSTTKKLVTILNRDDIDKLFNLLKTYFPNAKRCDDKKLKYAWFLLLEPYSYETARGAVVSALRGNVNFPDPQKIAVQCEAVETSAKKTYLPERQHSYADTAWMAPYIHRLAEKITSEDAEEIHAAGLLTWPEAEAEDMTFRDWNRAYRAGFPAEGGKT